MRIVITAVIGLSLAAAPASAQQAQPDPRWLPFIGCWEREPAMAMPPAVRLTCVLPTEMATAVDFVTVADGRPVASERIVVASGDQPLDREGCSGTERTAFARRDGLVYRTFEAHCQAGIARTASQLMALVPGAGWVDVQVMSVLGEHAQRVFRYTESIDPDLAPEIAARLDGLVLAAREARAAADEPVRVPDVVEASREVGTQAVQAWLASGPRMLPVDRRNLLAAQRAGLPDEVLDMMVAMSYPERFWVDSSGLAIAGPGMVGSGMAFAGAGYSGAGYGGSPLLYDDGLSPCTSYTERQYALSEYNCRRYGYDPFSLSGYGYWSWEVRTVFMPASGAGGGSASVAAAPHGRVVNGSGYSAGAGAVSTREAHPSSDGSTGTTSLGGGSTGASSSGAGGVNASSTGNTGGGRTAKPRP